MKRFNLIKNEDGAVMPLVALVLSIVLLGFAALVIDVGILYAERRTMVTAADAAALAGAMEMRDALGSGNEGAAEGKSRDVAKRIAMANGVKGEENIKVEWDNPDYGRATITVKVHNNKDLIFAKFLGFDDTDVGAKSVATWGYVYKLLGGDILPIFAKDNEFRTSETIYLHDEKIVIDDKNTGNWGYIDIFKSASKIGDAFEGKKVDMDLQISAIIGNQPGVGEGHVVKPIQRRMEEANKLDEKEDRIKYMSGLVPVIDWEKAAKSIQGSKLQLPIKYFAVFEIQDVIVNSNNNRSVGAPEALYHNDEYRSSGVAKEYPPDLRSSTIIGKFTGEIVDIVAVIDPDDQNNPNTDDDTDVIPPKYHKLIE